MAKTYLEIVKYMVEARFTIDGMVDKPDIIGAVFGQTEGLLGNELDLRELQKNGKIGRIEIDLQQGGNKAHGRLYLPASLDKVETCILAAAVEAVDRVGPYEAQFTVEKVEDTRSEKRRKILARAKDLVRILMSSGNMPDSKEISELVQADVRVSEIVAYGPEKLPAGPEVGKSEDIIIVEGRADVLNLLKNDITNAVAVGGATNNIPKSIIDLCTQKESTIFVDGDRGGDLITRSLMNVAEIDYVTKAPDGKEVEDLTRKEIIKALRARVPVDQEAMVRQQKKFQSGTPPPPQPIQRPRQPPQSGELTSRPPSQLREPAPQPRGAFPVPTQEPEGGSIPKIESQGISKPAGQGAVPQPALQSVILSQLSAGLDQLAGTLRSRLYDQTGNVIKEVPIRELLVEVQDSNGAYAIVLDGVITQRLVELAKEKGIKAVYGNRANPFQRKENDIILYTRDQGTL